MSSTLKVDNIEPATGATVTITGFSVGTIAVAGGGTGATDAATARTNLGAAKSGANTDITSLSAPALGAATATTQSEGDNSTKVATTAYADGKISKQFVNAKGDLVTATADNTPAIQTAGSNNTLLGYDSTQTNGLRAFAAGSGITISAGTISASSSAALPIGHLHGLTLSNNAIDAANDIDIALGKARDSTDAADMSLAAGITKQLDAAWAVGTNQGGLDTGTASNTTYFVWLIKRSDTGVVDVLFSLSASAPTMPANYDYKRRIGAILRESGSIVGFIQNGDDFERKSPVQDVSATGTGSASKVSRTLSVPIGIKVKAKMAITIYPDTENGYVRIFDVNGTDAAPTYNAAPGSVVTANIDQLGSGLIEQWTNTSGQIASRTNFTNAGSDLYIVTLGWTDHRGRTA